MKEKSAFIAMLLLAVVLGGIFLIALKSQGPLSTVSQTDKTTGQTTITLAPPSCDPQATQSPELRYALKNQDNPQTEYLAVKTYVYEGEFSATNLPTDASFKTTFTTATTGIPARGSGVDIDCGKKYTIVVPAVDGVSTSTMFVMESASNDNTKVVSGTTSISNESGLIARIYDDEAKAFVYGSADTSAGTWHARGTTYYSTTSNSSGNTIIADGYYRYTISVETNATASTTSRFNDQETTVAIDRQSSAQWDSPNSLTFNGVDLIGNKYSLPTKLANLNYDDGYLVPNNPTIKSAVKDLKVEQHALSGINPTDDIGVGIFTSGYYISTKDNSAKLGYAKDDPSATLVYTNYFTATLSME